MEGSSRVWSGTCKRSSLWTKGTPPTPIRQWTLENSKILQLTGFINFIIYHFLRNEGLNWPQLQTSKANANVYWSKQNVNLKHLFIWQTLTHQSSVISQDHLLFLKLSPVLVPIGHNWNRKYQQNMSVVVEPSENKERGTLGDWTLNISKKGKDCMLYQQLDSCPGDSDMMRFKLCINPLWNVWNCKNAFPIHVQIISSLQVY